METQKIELSTKNCKLELSSDEENTLGLATVKGKISEADIINANNFYIAKKEWEDMLENPVNKEKFALGKMYGCVGHDERAVDNFDIRKGEVSHIIKKLWMDGNDVLCEATILDTPSGKNLLACLKGGGYMQASTRLSVDETELENGVRGLVGANSEILTVDFVIDPAIESTYIQLASKDSTIEESDELEKDYSIELNSKELDCNISFYSELLEREKKINNILKHKKGEN